MAAALPEDRPTKRHTESADLSRTFRLKPGSVAVSEPEMVGHPAEFWFLHFTLCKQPLEDSGSVERNSPPSDQDAWLSHTV